MLLTRRDWLQVKRCLVVELGRPRRLSPFFLSSERSRLHACISGSSLSTNHRSAISDLDYVLFWDFERQEIVQGRIAAHRIVQHGPYMGQREYLVTYCGVGGCGNISRSVFDGDLLTRSSLIRHRNVLLSLSNSDGKLTTTVASLWDSCLLKGYELLRQRWGLVSLDPHHIDCLGVRSRKVMIMCVSLLFMARSHAINSLEKTTLRDLLAEITKELSKGASGSLCQDAPLTAPSNSQDESFSSLSRSRLSDAFSTEVIS